MDVKILYIIRGLPGSGKSTLAKQLAPDNHYEADDYFMVNGKYMFDKTKLKAAHMDCRKKVENDMKKGIQKIAVANTFIRKWEYQPYVDLASHYGYLVVLKVCTGNYKNIHGVPDDVINRMKGRFEN